MALDEKLNEVIEAIYGAAASPEAWPNALKASTELIGGVGATLEVVNKSAFEPVMFRSFGVPEASEIDYLEEFISLSPRVPHVIRQRPGHIGYDYQILTEADMDRNAFYSAFLPKDGFRYFISGCLLQNAEQYSAVAIQRAPRQGHVQAREIALMKQLVPHFRQALDLSMRWRQVDQARADSEHALDQLRDGVIVFCGDGTAVHVNRRAEEILREKDGLTLSRGALTIAGDQAMRRFKLALKSAFSAGDRQASKLEFTVGRPSGKSPYVFVVRPYRDSYGQARAVVFIHDPRAVTGSGRGVLREAFGLTDAEANLAVALVGGQSPRQYAETKGLSIHTVYSHYRRLKEKTGSSSQLTLIADLKNMSTPVVR